MKTPEPNPAYDKFVQGLQKVLRESYENLTGAEIVAVLENAKFATQMMIWESLNSSDWKN